MPRGTASRWMQGAASAQQCSLRAPCFFARGHWHASHGQHFEPTDWPPIPLPTHARCALVSAPRREQIALPVVPVPAPVDASVLVVAPPTLARHHLVAQPQPQRSRKGRASHADHVADGCTLDCDPRNSAGECSTTGTSNSKTIRRQSTWFGTFPPLACRRS